MTREQLEHVIRAAADIADDDEIVIIGSQAVLGQFPAAPPSMLVSNEADVFPKNRPERADLIDGCIGEGSPFHETYGYYAQGVGRETAVLPEGWEERLVVVKNARTRGASGLCLEVHDLSIAKIIAGREKDVRFLEDAVRGGLVEEATLRARLDATDVDDARRALAERRIARAFRRGG